MGWILMYDLDDLEADPRAAAEWGGTIEQFLADNAEDEETCEAVRALQCGQSVDVGGGAAPAYRLHRSH